MENYQFVVIFGIGLVLIIITNSLLIQPEYIELEERCVHSIKNLNKNILTKEEAYEAIKEGASSKGYSPLPFDVFEKVYSIDDVLTAKILFRGNIIDVFGIAGYPEILVTANGTLIEYDSYCVKPITF